LNRADIDTSIVVLVLQRNEYQPKFAVDAAGWFEVVEVEPSLHVVAEPGHVFSWLIHGSERSVLLDTGLGIADVAAAIAPVTTSPVSVVNSHTHFDHVGGNELFDEVAMHEAGPEWIEHGSADWELEAYGKVALGMAESYERLEAIDREAWFLLGPDQRVRPWPAAEIAAAGGWHIDPPQPQRLLADGDLVELGDRHLRVIHTPGHCPDHICLLDEAAGILFAQDQAYYGPHLIYLPESDLADFARSARRLADELRGSLRAVFVAHCLRPSVPPGFLDELADAAEEVAAGEARLEPAPGLFGEPLLGADHGHFSILVPKDFQA
jgi:glyoxylase-like metal-dependent hydrolase (beta-lactamase superfamily II)